MRSTWGKRQFSRRASSALPIPAARIRPMVPYAQKNRGLSRTVVAGLFTPAEVDCSLPEASKGTKPAVSLP
jgi:hypothetical protein